jgi:hypothetical protein
VKTVLGVADVEDEHVVVAFHGRHEALPSLHQTVCGEFKL